MNNTTQAKFSSKTPEWYTPQIYVEAARLAMGSINLDPASTPFANQVVKAKEYYTIEQDGLGQPWAGNLFVNPPHGWVVNPATGKKVSGQALWTSTLIERYMRGSIYQAILLVDVATGMPWFDQLWAYPLCFTHRIAFYNENGPSKQPTHDNVFAYLGPHPHTFGEVFRHLGVVVEKAVPKATRPLDTMALAILQALTE